MWLESLQRAIDYIEENLLEIISIERIAKQANFSVFHFQRMFTLLTGITVTEYVRRRRLTLAAIDLHHTNLKVIDLAMKYGFETPEAFSKAFRRQHGLSPREARKNKGKLTSYQRLVIHVNLKGAEPMKYRFEKKEAFDVTGLKREYEMKGGEPPDGIPRFWEEVNADGTVKQLIDLNNGSINGVLGICVDDDSEKIDYWIASAHEGETPERFKRLTIPAANWVVFEVNGPMPNAMQQTWKKIFSEWFPSSGYDHTGGPELELYTDGDTFSENYYSEIWIPIEKK